VVVIFRRGYRASHGGKYNGRTSKGGAGVGREFGTREEKFVRTPPEECFNALRRASARVAVGGLPPPGKKLALHPGQLWRIRRHRLLFWARGPMISGLALTPVGRPSSPTKETRKKKKKNAATRLGLVALVHRPFPFWGQAQEPGRMPGPTVFFH